MSCTYTRSKIGEGRGKKNFFPPQTVNANWGNILIVLSEQVRNSSPQERVAHDLKRLTTCHPPPSNKEIHSWWKKISLSLTPMPGNQTAPLQQTKQNPRFSSGLSALSHIGLFCAVALSMAPLQQCGKYGRAIFHNCHHQTTGEMTGCCLHWLN